MTKDGRAYMSERGVRRKYQDRSVVDLAAMKDAKDRGRMGAFLAGGAGLMLTGPQGYDATVLVARWHILDQVETMVTSALELARGQANTHHTEEGYRTILNDAGLICLVDFQNGDEGCPFTNDERYRVQRFVVDALDDKRKVIIHVRDVKLEWWAPWFREFIQENFTMISVDG